MCDYSLHNVKSRLAKVGDKLTTRDFGTGTRGSAASEDVSVAVCVLPGTELSFADEVSVPCVAVDNKCDRPQDRDLPGDLPRQQGDTSRCPGIPGWKSFC